MSLFQEEMNQELKKIQALIEKKENLTQEDLKVLFLYQLIKESDNE